MYEYEVMFSISNAPYKNYLHAVFYNREDFLTFKNNLMSFFKENKDKYIIYSISDMMSAGIDISKEGISHNKGLIYDEEREIKYKQFCMVDTNKLKKDMIETFKLQGKDKYKESEKVEICL